MTKSYVGNIYIGLLHEVILIPEVPDLQHFHLHNKFIPIEVAVLSSRKPQ